MKNRIEGATLPGSTITVTDETGSTITDGLSYTWTCEASTAIDRTVVLWTKSTGITATVSGCTVSWLDADIGSLTANGAIPASYILEFTGVKSGGGRIKHQEALKISEQVIAGG